MASIFPASPPITPLFSENIWVGFGDNMDYSNNIDMQEGAAEIEASPSFPNNLGNSLTLLFASITFLLVYWTRIGISKRKGKEGLRGLSGPEILPGPRSWDPTGIFGNGFEFLPIEKAMGNILNWGQTYGDVFKISGLSQTWVCLNSGPAVQTLLKSVDVGHHSKSPALCDLAQPYITNGVVLTVGKFWAHQRKILLKSQSYQSLKAYVPMLNKHCKLFVKDLGSLFGDGKPHQINDLINSSFLKVICEMITGLENEQSEECTKYHHNFKIWKEYLIYRILHPWLLVRPIWKLTQMSRDYEKIVEEMSEFARRRIREHREKIITPNLEVTSGMQHEQPNSDEQPFRSVLDYLLEAEVEEGQIVEEINTMIFAGHETGATVIHFFCLCMALNPEIQREAQQEVDELFEDLQCFQNNEITFEAVNRNLKFVERCVLETLRIVPPIFAFIRKLNSPLTVDYKGQDVVLPPGTNACISPYTLHRKAEYYPEPDKFDPNRFLPEECAKRPPYTFVPFSAGLKNCLGMKFAMIEMKIVAAYILRHFFIATKEKMEDVILLPFVSTTPSKDFTFQFSPREGRLAVPASQSQS